MLGNGKRIGSRFVLAGSFHFLGQGHHGRAELGVAPAELAGLRGVGVHRWVGQRTLQLGVLLEQRVEVVRAGERRDLVAVQAGLFDTAGGRVQVEGDLREGDRVAVPSL